MSQATLAQLLHSKIEGFHASIRKRKRMKMFDNKRLKLQSSLILLENDDDETTALKKEITQISIKPLFQNERRALFKALKDESNEQIISSFREIRKLINLFNEGTCEDSEKGLLDPELIATMVNLVVAKNFKNLELMEEIFWILINFTYFQSPLMIFFKGSVMIKTCIKIVFSDESEFLINNALWLLGNMLEEVDGMSKGLLEKNIIKRIQELIEKSEKPLDFQKSLVFLLQNFSKSKPILLYSEIRNYIPLLVNYLCEIDNWEVYYCCFSALSSVCTKILRYDSEMLPIFINDIKDCKGYDVIALLAEKALKMNQKEGEEILSNITKILGTLATGENLEIQFLFDKGIVDLIQRMLEHKSINVRRNAAWILSNLLAGDYSQVSYILIKDSLINKLMTILASSDAIDLKINVSSCFINTMSIIDEFFFDKFLKRGLLKVMFDQLNVNSVVDYLEVLLEGIEYFLMYGAQVSGPDQINFIIPIIASYGYLQKIDELQFHVNKSVCNKVSLIVDKYFQNLD